jgi:3-oxoacyl-[acyl-carrier protein] reductase
VSDAHERRLAETAEQLVAEAANGAADRVHAIACDVTDETQVGALYEGTVARFGRLDVAVHNAGLGGTVPLVEMTDDQWAKVLDITLTGTFRCTRAAMKVMLPERSGVIVNNASVLGWRAQPGQAHYAAAKAGVMALTRCAAAEAAPYGVRVNAVSPSLAEHAFLNRAIPEEDLAVLRRRELFGRGAETWEVANVIVFLASDYSSFMSGEIVSVSSQHP